LVAGTFAAISPSFITIVNAQQYGMDQKYNNYELDYGMDRYDDKQSYGKDSNSYDKYKDSSNVKCNNINVNVNGFNGATLPTALSGLATDNGAQASADEGERGASGSDGGRPSGSDTDFRYVCINNNNNNVVAEEQTSTLTVNKEVFGCEHIITSPPILSIFMNCNQGPDNPSFPWINCDSPSMAMENFCEGLPENLFDIQVLSPQNNPQIPPFVAPEDGRTFDNLQPGTYTVEEIKYPPGSVNQLSEAVDLDNLCRSFGFTDGGFLDNQNAGIAYSICFEYEDEQGNDCSTITLAAGESRTCTVKNYINQGEDFPT
jgi:hypothetical protein